MDRAPITYHYAVKAPLAAQYAVKVFFVGGGKNAVDFIVCGHNRPGTRFLYYGFKGCQVYFPHGALVHFRRRIHTAVFLIVGKEMFNTGSHSPALKPLHKGGTQFTGKQRVFAEIFKIASTDGQPFHVKSRPQQQVDTHRLTFPAYFFTHPGKQIPVET